MKTCQAVTLAALVALPLACRRTPEGPSPRLEQLRSVHEQLHQRLAQLTAGDTLLAEVTASGGDVAVGLRASLVRGVFEQVARRYLDRVVLDLRKEIQVRGGGDVKTKTFLGTIKAGAWKIDLTIHRIRGVLRARSPRAEFGGGNRVRVGLGIVLEGAEGTASLRFGWDASGLASVVCHDFEVTQEIKGTVLPEVYPVAGAFLLSSRAETVVAQPEFPDKAFRLRIDLSPESWDEVRKMLEQQDTFLKCGMALDPDAVMPRLKELGQSGFDVHLPRTLFRKIELPASVQSSVAVEDHHVSLDVRPNALRVSNDALWYSAAIRSRVTADHPAPPTPAPPHFRMPFRKPSPAP